MENITEEIARNAKSINEGLYSSQGGVEYHFKNDAIAEKMVTLAFRNKLDISGTGPKSFIIWS